MYHFSSIFCTFSFYCGRTKSILDDEMLENVHLILVFFIQFILIVDLKFIS